MATSHLIELVSRIQIPLLPVLVGNWRPRHFRLEDTLVGLLRAVPGDRRRLIVERAPRELVAPLRQHAMLLQLLLQPLRSGGRTHLHRAARQQLAGSNGDRYLSFALRA